ncbi:glycosyl transferase family A [Streptomyces sulfonofaciens]|uniref:Glycosyl transferase family A n=1 Tax=Streptomyces sulfonofaciens TaxID=68272 RepID=A0A919G1E7_9ACTN|nr:bifunctional glycosyltransferase family 2 protein/CDP-glycerol:glycerophosphate glycerophosphotransferase [Streptomyces sulfonofaciens]GHH76310.1 glycosyl transferase family A [Streptomyces sulfonofaciens]
MPESSSPAVPPAVPSDVPLPAPRFSVIVPGHGVAGRLAQTLDSVLGQRLDPSRPAGAPGRDGAGHGAGDTAAPAVEVIAVCAAADSLDACVAERLARRDARVRPVWSPPEAGLSGARNTGLTAARGDYVLFLDGDDTLAPGALHAVEARLRRTGDVDVLYLGHERVHWWKGPQPGDSPGAEQLAHAPEGAFAPEEAPALTGTALPAWSAVHRRAFLAAHSLAFPAGFYTDIGWGGLELLAARRVAVLPRVCVRHLLRRQGSRLRQPGEHHFDLLDQVDLVLTRARRGPRGTAHALTAARLHALFAELTAQMLRTAAAAPILLPDGAGRLFFERAGELYRRHRPIGFHPPLGRLGVQHRLLATGSYRAFAALRGARRGARRAARGAASSATRVRAHRRRHHALYQAALRRPVDENLAVYCAYWGRGYACNPAAVHAAARRLAPHIRSVFLVTEDAVDRMPEGVEHAVLGTPRSWELLARAKYLINNANFAGAVVKRPGTVHLQTQHGTPLKKMGIEQAEYPVVAAQSGSFGGLLSRVDRWDFNLSSNRHSSEVWEREFPAGYEMLEYGYPRNDVYQSASAADVARIRRELGVPEDRTAILYAPTHRDYRTAFRAHLDLEAFCAAAGEEFVVLLRAHYFYEDDGPGPGGPPGGGRVIDVTGHRSAEEVCLAADALVTDYSSIMFDYANLDRPIVVYADDWDVYRETRGVTFDLMAHPPGPVAGTEEELAGIFRDGSWAGPRSTELRGRFRERFCTFDDGHAAERVVRRVLLGEPPGALPPLVPLAERTPAPAARPAPRSHPGPGPGADRPQAGAAPGAGARPPAVPAPTTEKS